MLVTFLIAFSSLFAATAAQCSNAQFTYSNYDNMCYYVSRTSATWANARTICHNMGGQLAVIHTVNNNIASDVAAYAVDPGLIFWIGLQLTTGMFKWVDGSMMDYTSWNTGFPQLTKGYDCVAARLSSSRGYWENLVCGNSYPYICQANATFVPTTTAGPFVCQNNPYYGPTGSITSPNYPRNYPDNARCVYNIILGAGTTVKLHMNDIQTEGCCDFLYIYNGPSTNSPLIQRCSGSTCTGQDFYATSNTMTLQFTSDQDTNFRGFNATYSTLYPSTTGQPMTTSSMSACSIYNATGSGDFYSLNFPQNYTNNLRCFYILNALPGRVPSIYFPNFQTEPGYDYLSFYDSTSVLFGANGVTFTGNPYLSLSDREGQGNVFLGRTQTTVLVFFTDGSIVFSGFHGQWTSVFPTSTTRGSG